tara:strand:+ start:61838 stop:61957 length:120 start_codon:yes stop_codon:yes gene_type:complete
MENLRKNIRQEKNLVGKQLHKMFIELILRGNETYCNNIK